MSIWYYVLRRVVFSAMVVLVVGILTFSLVSMAPGDPAVLLAGDAASPDYIKLVRAEYGLDRPFPEQLATYITNLLKGNLGFSLTFNKPVIDVIIERLPQTLLLVGTALSLAIFIGVSLGIASAKKPYSKMDTIINAASLTLYSIPVFWLSLLLILAFALMVPVFPTGGLYDYGVEKTLPGLIVDVAWHLFLPMIALSAYFLATYSRLTRAGLLEALGMNYIVQARAKGVSEHDVLYHHALKNALLPVVTVAGIQVGLMIGGVVLTESVFSWPGIGSLLVQAVSYRDYPLVSGIFIVTAISVSLSNLAADVAYGIIDPRIRTASA